MVHEHESGPAVNMPYFFLSYARTPKRDQNDKSDPDRWVYKLYRDLCENILSLINVEPESVGFMDRENRLGVRWSEELTRALATCRVFVPLYSERYFESENCGKEWFAFARRELTHIARGPQPSMSAIVPVLWTTIDQSILPGAARSIQYNHRDLGARYCADGFYGIIKLNRYRDDYQLAVLRLAQRIVAVARETRISNEPPADYDALPSAFPPAPHRAGMTASDMQITVLALDNSNLPAGRTDAYYGNTPRTWSPYRPHYSQPLAEYAGKLAKCSGYEPVVGTFDEHNARWAINGQPVPPGLCLIDAWASLSPAYQDQLRQLDAIEQPWVSVLVPWNVQDAEMTAAEKDLRVGLNSLLNRKLASVPRRCQMAAYGIPTLPDFGDLLPRMAMIMMKRFRRDESTPAYPPEGPATERPRLRRTDSQGSGGSK